MQSRRSALLVSVLLYVAACALPAVRLHLGGTSYRSPLGIELLFAVPFGLLRLNFAGLANPLLWLSWLFLGTKQYGAAVWTAIAALLFALETFQLIWQPYIFDEAGTAGYLAAPHLGWLCWAASMCVILAAGRRLNKRLADGLAQAPQTDQTQAH